MHWSWRRTVSTRRQRRHPIHDRDPGRRDRWALAARHASPKRALRRLLALSDSTRSVLHARGATSRTLLACATCTSQPAAASVSRTQIAPLIISTTAPSSRPTSSTSRARPSRRPVPLPRRPDHHPGSAHTTPPLDTTSRSRDTASRGLLTRIGQQTKRSVCSAQARLPQRRHHPVMTSQARSGARSPFVQGAVADRFPPSQPMTPHKRCRGPSRSRRARPRRCDWTSGPC
jgi:hypothetical protein